MADNPAARKIIVSGWKSAIAVIGVNWFLRQ